MSHPEHLCQALSWLNGHWYISDQRCQEQIGEKILVNSHYYIVHPPGAAVVSLLAKLMGLTDAIALGCLVGAATVTAIYVLTSSLWLTVLFAIGTNFWYETSGGRPWGMTSCLGAMWLTLALCSKQSSSKQGFFVGLACITRYDLIGSIVAFRWNKRFWLALLPAIIFYVINAHERLGGWWDYSIPIWYHHDGHVVDNSGPFSIRYLPWNIYTLLFLGPSYFVTFPWIRPTTLGQSIFVTSPALILITTAGFKRHWRIWLAIVLCSGPLLLVWSNGYVQFGPRYYIMIYPLLMCLLATQTIGPGVKCLTVLSILFNAYGVWYIRSGYPF